MKRIWRPLDVGGLRLYKVQVRYMNEKGYDLHQGHECLVMANRPMHAANLVQKMVSFGFGW